MTEESLQALKVLIRKHYEQSHAHKFNSLDEMDIRFERHKLPKLTSEERGNLSSPISITENAYVLKSLTSKETLGPDDLTGKFYQTIKEEIIPILCKSFQKKYQGTLSNSL